MGRAPCCDKTAVKKGPWSPEEDAMLKSYIEKYGTGNNWISLPHKIGIKRCGKSCRLRWLNYLRPNIKHGSFTDEEDYIICSLYITIGSRWSIIASQLPGRTDNDIKNYWNTRLKKKLLSKQGKTFHQELNVKFSYETTSTRSSSLVQNQIQMIHDDDSKSPLNETLYNQVMDPTITSFAMEEESMIKNHILDTCTSFEPNKVWFDAAASSYHHRSSPSLNSMSSSSSIDTNYSSLQMSHYTINNNDHGDHQEKFDMTGFENLQAELFDEIINDNTQQILFSGTETLNNNFLDHDISSFIDYPLYDNDH